MEVFEKMSHLINVWGPMFVRVLRSFWFVISNSVIWTIVFGLAILLFVSKITKALLSSKI